MKQRENKYYLLSKRILEDNFYNILEKEYDNIKKLKIEAYEKNLDNIIGEQPSGIEQILKDDRRLGASSDDDQFMKFNNANENWGPKQTESVKQTTEAYEVDQTNDKFFSRKNFSFGGFNDGGLKSQTDEKKRGLEVLGEEEADEDDTDF